MNQDDYNGMMKLPWECGTPKSVNLPSCPCCGEKYLGDGKELCIECEANKNNATS